MMNPHQTELGELKEVIGKLWKSIDSLKLSMVESDQRTQQQITEWTQINLQLLQLLADKTQEATQLAEHYEKLTSYLVGFDRNCRSLNQQITALGSTSTRLNNPGTQNQPIMHKLTLMERVLDQSNDRLQRLLNSTSIRDQSQWTWIYSAHWLLSLVAVVFICLMMRSHVQEFQAIHEQFNPLNDRLDYITDRVRWTLTKLQRMER